MAIYRPAVHQCGSPGEGEKKNTRAVRYAPPGRSPGDLAAWTKARLCSAMLRDHCFSAWPVKGLEGSGRQARLMSDWSIHVLAVLVCQSSVVQLFLCLSKVSNGSYCRILYGLLLLFVIYTFYNILDIILHRTIS